MISASGFFLGGKTSGCGTNDLISGFVPAGFWCHWPSSELKIQQK